MAVVVWRSLDGCEGAAEVAVSSVARTAKEYVAVEVLMFADMRNVLLCTICVILVASWLKRRTGSGDGSQHIGR